MGSPGVTRLIAVGKLYHLILTMNYGAHTS